MERRRAARGEVLVDLRPRGEPSGDQLRFVAVIAVGDQPAVIAGEELLQVDEIALWRAGAKAIPVGHAILVDVESAVPGFPHDRLPRPEREERAVAELVTILVDLALQVVFLHRGIPAVRPRREPALEVIRT